MAVGSFSHQYCGVHHRSRGTLILSSVERDRNPNVNRSPRRKRSARRFHQNAEYGKKPNYGNQQPAMDFGPVRILKRGEVLDETTEVDFNESEKKQLSGQIRYSDSNVGETFSGLTCVDSPHPSLVPFPTFLVKRDDPVSNVNRRPAPDLDLRMDCQTEFFKVLI